MTIRRLLRGGLVADGIGRDTVAADVLIDGSTIIAVGPDLAEHPDAETVTLPPGSVVCPGFIDAHVHAEGPLVDTGVVTGALAQGVTTLVVGQDGSSWIGGSADAVAYLNDYFGPVNGRLPGGGPCPLDTFRDLVAGRLQQNVAVLASQGTIRYALTGTSDRPLTDEEIRAARADVEQALTAGAVGLSSGLDYVPSRFGLVNECAAIAAPLTGERRPYVSHLRAYGPQVRAGLTELIQIGERAAIPVHASHLWGDPADIDKALSAADEIGVPVTYDMYPYIRSSTILAMLLLPSDIQRAGVTATVTALADPTTRDRLLSSEAFSDTNLANITLGSLPDSHAHHAGKTISVAARDDGQSPGPWTLDLLAGSNLQVGAHLDRPVFTENHLHQIITSPRHCAGSDGIYQGQHPHPRGFGAFARLAAAYRRDGAPDYQTIARHLSTHAADAYGLTSRGRIAPGTTADITVIAPTGLVDTATYDAPTVPAGGVSHVLVNGTPVWTDGAATGPDRPGQMISR